MTAFFFSFEISNIQIKPDVVVGAQSYFDFAIQT